MFRSLVLVSLGVLAVGCGGDPVPADGPDGGAGAGADADTAPPDAGVEHYLMPVTAYSGFDGANTFRVPAYTSLEEAVFEMADEAVAGIEPVELSAEYEEVLGTFGRSWAMITTRQPGTTVYAASAGAVRLEATLVVTTYDPADVAVGAERYNEPVDGDQPDRVACQLCHGGPDGVDHTPLALAYLPDDQVLPIITDALYPTGDPVNGGDHSWNLTEAEAAGIVPYLRSLAPRGF